MNKMVELKNNEPLYTLGIIEKLSGIPVHSIRQYIDKGLVIPLKLDSKRHLFSKADLIRLKFIQKCLNEKGLNIAGIKSLLGQIPCWVIRNCSAQDRKNCNAYHSTTNPCWEASEKGRICKNENCRECEVYRMMEKDLDIKSFLKNLL